MKYYTASEARKVLGNINPSALKYLYDHGILKRYIPPGKRQGLYSKAEVDALVEAQRRFYSGEKERI